jgi:uncharacterized Zn-binding protein involved in type VI secretion
MHTCPMFDGPKPHVGGPILPPGAPTVLIAGMPAARVGDMCTCVGPPDTIAMGSTKVMIGGMPAARMGDMTAHGGVITLGAPNVMIHQPRRRGTRIPPNVGESGSEGVLADVRCQRAAARCARRARRSSQWAPTEAIQAIASPIGSGLSM